MIKRFLIALVAALLIMCALPVIVIELVGRVP